MTSPVLSLEGGVGSKGCGLTCPPPHMPLPPYPRSRSHNKDIGVFNVHHLNDGLWKHPRLD